MNWADVLPKTVCLLWPQQDLSVCHCNTPLILDMLKISVSFLTLNRQSHKTHSAGKFRKQGISVPHGPEISRTSHFRFIYKYSHHNIYTLENPFSSHCLWTDWASARSNYCTFKSALIIWLHAWINVEINWLCASVSCSLTQHQSHLYSRTIHTHTPAESLTFRKSSPNYPLSTDLFLLLNFAFGHSVIYVDRRTCLVTMTAVLSSLASKYTANTLQDVDDPKY